MDVRRFIFQNKKKKKYHLLTLKVPSVFFINDTRKTSTGMRAVVRSVTLSATTEDVVVDIVPSRLLIKYFTYATENIKISYNKKIHSVKY
jgi:hypothetical protein